MTLKYLSRKEALEILNGMKVKIKIPKAAVMQNKRNAALDMAIEALKYSEIPNSSTDCISRQAAIDALDEQIEQCNKALGSFDISPKDEYAIKVEKASLKAYKEQLENMPSAQPEKIQCRDCRFNDGTAYCEFHFRDVKGEDYCSWAERRTDG